MDGEKGQQPQIGCVRFNMQIVWKMLSAFLIHQFPPIFWKAYSSVKLHGVTAEKSYI